MTSLKVWMMFVAEKAVISSICSQMFSYPPEWSMGIKLDRSVSVILPMLWVFDAALHSDEKTQVQSS